MKKAVQNLEINEEYFKTHKAIPFSLNKRIYNKEIISWNLTSNYYPINMQDINSRVKYVFDNIKSVGLDDIVTPDQPSNEELIENCHEITEEELLLNYESDQFKKHNTIWLNDKLYNSVFIKKETRDKIKDKYNRSVSLVFPAADCAIVRYYDKKKDIIGITHSDALRTKNNIIKDMTNYMKNHFKSNLEDIEVYVSAFAYDDWYYDTMPKFMYEYDSNNNIIGLNNEWKDYIEYIEDNKYKINYGDKILDQIINSGIKEENIFFSNENTLYNEEYFSNSNSTVKGLKHGRNLFGITFDVEEIIKNKEKSGIILK